MPSAAPFRDAFWNVSLWAALGASMLVSSFDISRAAEPPTGLTILQEMRSFSTMCSLLYIAAHPDDENTQVYTYLIRVLPPHIIVTRFSPQPRYTHGHHTASAVLALEAFNLAADPQAFPEQLGELTPWQPKRIFHNVGPFGGARADAASNGTGVVRVEVGGNDPVLGESFASIAARSRGMHKPQG